MNSFPMLGKILVGITLVSFVAPLQAQDQIVPAAARQSEVDQPIAWMQEAKRNYAVVKDYTCTLASQENVSGKLQEKNIIQFKMKTEPFSVYMRWIAPEASAGQEVAFVLGKNNNKMRVKKSGFGKNVLGFISIDPNDKRVTEHSRHTILEAGIGNMIEHLLSQWQKDRQIDRTKVDVKAFVFNGRPCDRIELTRTEKNAAFYCHRTIVYLEKSSKLPVLLENYDWPRQGGPAGGDLLESFSYINLQFNTGLTNADFNK